MNEKLFRKSSVDRVNSPEQLNDYIRVANPSVWILLAAIVILLVGVVIWGIFGTIETKVEGTAVVSSGTAICYVTDPSDVKAGLEVRIDDKEGTVKAVGSKPVEITDDMGSYFMFLSSLSSGSFAYPVEVEVPSLEDGVYSAEIVVSDINPIYFVIH